MCVSNWGCNWRSQRDSIPSKQSNSKVGHAQKEANSIPSHEKAIDVDTEIKVAGSVSDRIKVLTSLQDERDHKAIQVAVEWLRTQSDEPIDVEVRLGKRGDSRQVYITYIFRNDSGESFSVPGGHCTLIISGDGNIVDVVRGA